MTEPERQHRRTDDNRVKFDKTINLAPVTLRP